MFGTVGLLSLGCLVSDLIAELFERGVNTSSTRVFDSIEMLLVGWLWLGVRSMSLVFCCLLNPVPFTKIRPKIDGENEQNTWTTIAILGHFLPP